MRVEFVALSISLSLAACDAPGTGAEPAAPAEQPAPAAAAEAPAPAADQAPESQPGDTAQGYTTSDSVRGDDGSRRFGTELNPALSELVLADVLKDPSPHVGQTIKTRGEVARVCQNMGCWLELRTDDQRLRVPMAGHALSIPQDAIGRSATVQGELRQRTLSKQQQEHLTSEGASAVGALALHAKAVVVH